MSERKLPAHIEAAFAGGGSVSLNGKSILTEKEFWEEKDEMDGVTQSEESKPSTTEPVSTSDDGELTKAKSDLGTEQEAHKATKAELTKAKSDLTATGNAAKASGKLLKALIPKKTADLAKLDENKLKLIASTYEVQTEGLTPEQALEAISKAVHG